MVLNFSRWDCADFTANSGKASVEMQPFLRMHNDVWKPYTDGYGKYFVYMGGCVKYAT